MDEMRDAIWKHLDDIQERNPEYLEAPDVHRLADISGWTYEDYCRRNLQPFDPLMAECKERREQSRKFAHGLNWTAEMTRRLRRPISVEDLMDGDSIVADEFGAKTALPDNRNRFPEYTEAEWREQSLGTA